MTLLEKIQSLIKDTTIEWGIAVQHIESGEETLINPDAPFPTASVFKVPVMVEVFKQARAGMFDLNDRIELKTEDKTLTTGILLHLKDGLQPSIYDLMMLMTIVSDNTATTMLMKLVGAQNITNSMHALGLHSIHVTITVHEMFLHAWGIQDRPHVTVEELTEIAKNTQMDYNSRTFSRGPDNDVSSARDMTRLMAMIYRGEVVDREACDEMLTILSHQQHNNRVPLYLPWYSVYHKTGSMRGLRNDSGIIFINPQSHAAFTVFSFDGTPLPLDDQRLPVRQEYYVAEIMGEIGKAIYDHYNHAEAKPQDAA